MFLYLRVQSPTAHANGRSRLSASRSTSRASLSLSAPVASRPFSARSAWSASRSLGGANEHEPWVMWYLSPLACLYDLEQLGFGHRKGLDSNRDEAGRDSVVEAREDSLPTGELGAGVAELDAADGDDGSGVWRGEADSRTRTCVALDEPAIEDISSCGATRANVGCICCC